MSPPCRRPGAPSRSSGGKPWTTSSTSRAGSGSPAARRRRTSLGRQRRPGHHITHDGPGPAGSRSAVGPEVTAATIAIRLGRHLSPMMGTMLVELRNPTEGPRRRISVLVSVLLERLDINRESVLVDATARSFPGDRAPRGPTTSSSAPVISGAAAAEVPRVPRTAVIDLPRLAPASAPSTSPGSAGTRSSDHLGLRHVATRDRILIRGVGRRTPWRSGTSCSGSAAAADDLSSPRHRRLQRHLRRIRPADSPAAAAEPRAPKLSRSTWSTTAIRHPRGARADAADAVQRDAACQSDTCSTAPPARQRLRRPGHRPQPRRRGRRAVRQRAALADRPWVSSAGAARPRRVPPQVKPLVRLSERRTAAYCIVSGIDYLVDECRCRRGTSTSATRRRSADRGALARLQGRLLLSSFAVDRFAPEPGTGDADRADPGCWHLRPLARVAHLDRGVRLLPTGGDRRIPAGRHAGPTTSPSAAEGTQTPQEPLTRDRPTAARRRPGSSSSTPRTSATRPHLPQAGFHLPLRLRPPMT